MLIELTLVYSSNDAGRLWVAHPGMFVAMAKGWEYGAGEEYGDSKCPTATQVHTSGGGCHYIKGALSENRKIWEKALKEQQDEPTR